MRAITVTALLVVLLALLCTTPSQRAAAAIEQGDRELLMGRGEQALTCYRQAAAIDGGSWRAWQRVGQVFLNAHRAAEAAGALREALRIRPDAPETLLQMAAADLQMRRWTEAAGRLRRALAVSPGNQEARVLMAQAAVGQGNPAQARRFLRQVLEINPSQWMAHSALGRLAESQGNWEAAAAEYRQSVGSTYRADAVMRFNLGICLSRMSRLAEAQDALREAAETDPQLADPHFVLGMMLCTSNPAQARGHLARYLQLQPRGESAEAARAALQKLQ